MHPRNFYKDNPPNFATLAQRYPEFGQHCLITETGKVQVDFKDAAVVRCLSKVLLKEDFNLDVELPADCLVPRLPQRLNYLLWLQDIIAANPALLAAARDGKISGIDIGTGASCIYPLLGASQYGWSFAASEKDERAADCARRNVARNALTRHVRVVSVHAQTALRGVVQQGTDYHFCMCNPPFYDSTEVNAACSEGDSLVLSSLVGDGKRGAPHSASVARLGEVSADGGELAFVARIIDDSLALARTVRFYTSMIGRKCNLKPLKKKLTECGAVSVATTAFCQGKTQRWGLAWTFDSDIKLNVGQSGKSEKKRPTLRLDLRPLANSNESPLNWCLCIIRSLKMRCLEQTTDDRGGASRSFECAASANTWSHQRRKRRHSGANSRNEQTSVKRCRTEKDRSVNEDDRVSNGGTSKCAQTAAESDTLLRFRLVVQQEGEAHADLEWIDGQNRDLLHQVWQFLTNALVSVNGGRSASA